MVITHFANTHLKNPSDLSFYSCQQMGKLFLSDGLKEEIDGPLRLKKYVKVASLENSVTISLCCANHMFIGF